MNHIDQKILELYVLNDKSALQQHEMIEKHLAECAGCRELYARMQDLYAGFFDTMNSSKEKKTDSILPIKPKRSLVVFNSPSPLQEIRANYEINRSPARNAITFVRKYPAVSSTISFFIVGFFVLLGWQVFKIAENVDDNPSYYRYNLVNGMLEIFSKQNKILWSAPVKDIEEAKKTEDQGSGKQTLIADIDGDDINEIISTLFIGSNKQLPSTIKIFNNKGILVKNFPFNDTSFFFRNIHYNANFSTSFLSSQQTSDGKINFYANGGSGRSPYFIARFDEHLNLVGRYWHFGHIRPLSIKIQSNSLTDILFGGKNDVEDNKNNDYAFITVIDPMKIIGEKEASDSRGFGLPLSDAEHYCIRFPITDLEKVLNIRSDAHSITFDNKELFSVSLTKGFDVDANNFIGFDYVFSKKDMSVLQVKYHTGTARTFDGLKKLGKIKGEFDNKYLENLKNHVEYWNGEIWVKKPITVSHSTKILNAR